jgi:putative hydrolase
MDYLGDYHTHTTYSHGKGSVFENAEAAVKKGFKQVAITDHGFRHMMYNVLRKEVPQMRADVTEAQKRYGIDVYLGIETNIVGSRGVIDLKEGDVEKLDIILCGYHKLIHPHSPLDGCYYLATTANWMFKSWSKKRLQKNTDMYRRIIENHDIDIITHINFEMKVDVYQVAKLCAEAGTFIELNGKRQHLTDEELTAMAETDVQFIVDSDAHRVESVGDFSIPLAQLENVKIDPSRIVNLGQLPRFRSRIKKGLYQD